MFRRRWLAVLGLLAACAAPAAAQEPPPPTAEAATEVVVQNGGYETTTTHASTTTTAAPTTTHASTTTTQPATTTTATTTPREVTTTTQATTTTSQPATSTTQATTTTTEAPKKVFVCKYTGTPGVDEALQGGGNPISVDYKPGREPGQYFNDAQGRSYVLEYDTGQDEPDVSECPPPNGGTTTTSSTSSTTSTTSSTTTTTQPATTTTTQPATTTTLPRPSLFAIGAAVPLCIEEEAVISITFGARPDLEGQVGTLAFSTGGSVPLTFVSGGTVQIPWPAGAGDIELLTYTLGTETATAGPLLFPEECPSTTTTTTGPTTSTTTTLPATTTTTTGPTTTGPTTTVGTTTTLPGPTTTTIPSGPTTTTTLPPGQPFAFGAAATVCVSEVPTIRIVFQNSFPQLAGQTGTLTMADVSGNVVSTQPLVYQPNTTVDLLYPGTRVNADGSIADVPGWNLTAAGLWVRDPSDEFLRAGIQLTYVVNPTATAFITYPPESAACANPDGPFPPNVVPPVVPPGTPRTPGAPPTPTTGLPATGSTTDGMVAIGFLSLGAGALLLTAATRRRRA